MTNRAAVQSIKDFGPDDRIALPGVKVSVQAVVLQMAAQQAFGAGQQYRLDPLTVSMGHPDGETALLGGRSQVTAHFTAAPFMYEEAAEPQVHRVLNSYDVLGGPHTFNVVWATTRWHDAHPQVAAAFLAALARAERSIIDDPAAAAAVWVRVEKAKLGVDPGGGDGPAAGERMDGGAPAGHGLRRVHGLDGGDRHGAEGLDGVVLPGSGRAGRKLGIGAMLVRRQLGEVCDARGMCGFAR